MRLFGYLVVFPPHHAQLLAALADFPHEGLLALLGPHCVSVHVLKGLFEIADTPPRRLERRLCRAQSSDHLLTLLGRLVTFRPKALGVFEDTLELGFQAHFGAIHAAFLLLEPLTTSLRLPHGVSQNLKALECAPELCLQRGEALPARRQLRLRGRAPPLQLLSGLLAVAPCLRHSLESFVRLEVLAQGKLQGNLSVVQSHEGPLDHNNLLLLLLVLRQQLRQLSVLDLQLLLAPAQRVLRCVQALAEERGFADRAADFLVPRLGFLNRGLALLTRVVQAILHDAQVGSAVTFALVARS
mmetsp:Transcript_116711/g.330150  ORF Transcript_116711/g.330150 Transcript_116711/m.330150 type:complete len:299 (-) Transcript_116711:663-1559(-)